MSYKLLEQAVQTNHCDRVSFCNLNNFLLKISNLTAMDKTRTWNADHLLRHRQINGIDNLFNFRLYIACTQK
mgnify:CR=1 FL=1